MKFTPGLRAGDPDKTDLVEGSYYRVDQKQRWVPYRRLGLQKFSGVSRSPGAPAPPGSAPGLLDQKLLSPSLVSFGGSVFVVSFGSSLNSASRPLSCRC